MNREQRMSTAERVGSKLESARISAPRQTSTWPPETSAAPTLASSTGRSTLRDVDPLVADIINREGRRQEEKLILIASESKPHPAVLEALASPFTSVYAEGHPPSHLREASLEDLSDVDNRLEASPNGKPRRFYQGTEWADLIECVAERRTAKCFATAGQPAESIHVNVQPLSGSVANLAVYEALLDPGDTILAMALAEGGHLTHGSPYSTSGRRFRAVFYNTDPDTGKLDYEAMRHLAKKHRPKLLVGGFTSYPWRPDWAAFRSIADDVGAMLLTDIAHTAGLIVGGVYPNPVGPADVVTFTTHKSLCGPRGAAILSTDKRIAKRLDRAVFPGLQGGPHVNKMAAIAVAMGLADCSDFGGLQQRTVDNAGHLAEALRSNGLSLAYGGTDTHLLLIDLRPLGVSGTLAARALDRAGIVCNRNVIPGDSSGADPSGIRLGTTWISQRGMGREEMVDLAGILAHVLKALAADAGRTGHIPLDSGRMARDLGLAAERVKALIARAEQA